MSWGHGFQFLAVACGFVCVASAWLSLTYTNIYHQKCEASMKVFWCFLVPTLLFGFLAASMLGGGR